MKKAQTYQPTYLREWREWARLSQETLSEHMGISAGHLSHVERGRKPYNQDLLEKAAAALSRYGAPLTPADLIERSPRAEATGSLLGLWREIPPNKQAAALTILRALATTGAQ